MALGTLPAVTQEPANLIRITKETINNVALPAVDLLRIRELLRAVADDLSWLEATVEEQVDQALLLWYGKHTEE